MSDQQTSPPNSSLDSPQNQTWWMHRLIGQEAMREDLAMDREQRRKWSEANHNLVYGDSGMSDKAKDMGDIIGGDRVEHHYHPAPPQVQSSGMSTIAKLAASAALVGLGGAGVGVPIAIKAMLDNHPQVEVIEKLDRERVEVLPPIVRKAK